VYFVNKTSNLSWSQFKPWLSQKKQMESINQEGNVSYLPSTQNNFFSWGLEYSLYPRTAWRLVQGNTTNPS